MEKLILMLKTARESSPLTIYLATTCRRLMDLSKMQNTGFEVAGDVCLARKLVTCL